MTSSELRAMVEAATPGHKGSVENYLQARAALRALAPSLARALEEAWRNLELVRNTLNVSPRAAADLDGLRDDVERVLAKLEELGE